MAAIRIKPGFQTSLPQFDFNIINRNHEKTLGCPKDFGNLSYGSHNSSPWRISSYTSWKFSHGVYPRFSSGRPGLKPCFSDVIFFQHWGLFPTIYSFDHDLNPVQVILSCSQILRNACLESRMIWHFSFYWQNKILMGEKCHSSTSPMKQGKTYQVVNLLGDVLIH